MVSSINGDLVMLMRFLGTGRGTAMIEYGLLGGLIASASLVAFIFTV
jgi:Flp pilus assembly pilin Flp